MEWREEAGECWAALEEEEEEEERRRELMVEEGSGHQFTVADWISESGSQTRAVCPIWAEKSCESRRSPFRRRYRVVLPEDGEPRISTRIEGDDEEELEEAEGVLEEVGLARIGDELGGMGGLLVFAGCSRDSTRPMMCS